MSIPPGWLVQGAAIGPLTYVGTQAASSAGAGITHQVPLYNLLYGADTKILKGDLLILLNASTGADVAPGVNAADGWVNAYDWRMQATRGVNLGFSYQWAPRDYASGETVQARGGAAAGDAACSVLTVWRNANGIDGLAVDTGFGNAAGNCPPFNTTGPASMLLAANAYTATGQYGHSAAPTGWTMCNNWTAPGSTHSINLGVARAGPVGPGTVDPGPWTPAQNNSQWGFVTMGCGIFSKRGY